ncbi:MAG: hypothetical protein ACFB10_14650 [Salibacteraceae bacterium]
MKYTLPLLLLLLCLSACKSVFVAEKSKQPPPESPFDPYHSVGILPKAVPSNIYIGMPREEFKQLHADQPLTEKNEQFRWTYLEEVDDPQVEAIGYYFDEDPPQRLYELIVIYYSEALRDEEASTLFGVPNFDEKEWRVSRDKGFNVWSWPFKTKLIVVGMIPGTEWSEKNW